MTKDLSTCAIAFVNMFDIENEEGCLSCAERQQLASFSCTKRISEYIAGRLAARHAIKLVSNNSEHFDVLHDHSGRPYIYGLNLGISISHSKEYACAIVFPKCYNIGIDIEKIDPAHCATLQKLFRSNDDISSLTSQWCIRESLFKIVQHNDSKIIFDGIDYIAINNDVDILSNIAYAIESILQCKTYLTSFNRHIYNQSEIIIRNYKTSTSIGISITVEDTIFAIVYNN